MFTEGLSKAIKLDKISVKKKDGVIVLTDELLKMLNMLRIILLMQIKFCEIQSVKCKVWRPFTK